MKLRTLLYVDEYRDGGSYGASFATDDGPEYSLWLQRSTVADAGGLHHRWLFEFQGRERPQNLVPVVTGSEDEQRIVGMLEEFLAVARSTRVRSLERDRAIEQLEHMLEYIRRREPCFPADLRANGFIV